MKKKYVCFASGYGFLTVGSESGGYAPTLEWQEASEATEEDWNRFMFDKFLRKHPDANWVLLERKK